MCTTEEGKEGKRRETEVSGYNNSTWAAVSWNFSCGGGEVYGNPPGDQLLLSADSWHMTHHYRSNQASGPECCASNSNPRPAECRAPHPAPDVSICSAFVAKPSDSEGPVLVWLSELRTAAHNAKMRTFPSRHQSPPAASYQLAEIRQLRETISVPARGPRRGPRDHGLSDHRTTDCSTETPQLIDGKCSVNRLRDQGRHLRCRRGAR